MSRFRISPRLRARRLARSERGGTLVEMAIVMPLLLLFIFGILDYGRLFWTEAMAQKATEMTTRIASVRGAACPGVPTMVGPASVPGEPAPRFGTLCRVGNTCANPGTVQCLMNDGDAATQAVRDEIWTRVEPLMPPNATRANLRIGYSFDERLGFLGGPYRPIITAEIVNLTFTFVSPLGRIAALAAADPNVVLAETITYPAFSVSLPAEDLSSGAP